MQHSYIEWVKEQPVPVQVDGRSGDVRFKMPWQIGKQEYYEVPGACRSYNSRSS